VVADQGVTDIFTDELTAL